MGSKRLNRPQEVIYTNLLIHIYKLADLHNDYIDAGKFQDADGGEECIVANWNRDYLTRAAKFLTVNYPNVRQSWEDTTMRCDDCGRFIETNPTHWGWQPKYIYAPQDAGYVCQECALNAPQDFIDAYTNNPKKAFCAWFTGVLEERGWKCFEPDTDGCARYESGLRIGQDDDPAKVTEYINATLPDYDIVFVITSTGQFDINWTAYIKHKEG